MLMKQSGFDYGHNAQVKGPVLALHIADLVAIEPPEDEAAPLEGRMAESHNWFALSHWAKTQVLIIKSFDRGFAFNIGRYLHHGWVL